MRAARASLLVSIKYDIFLMRWAPSLLDGSEPSTRDLTAEILLQMWRNWGGGAKIPCGLGLLKKEISLNRIVGTTNQNVWVPPDVGPTRIYHESTWVLHVGLT
jgi:hypothetical protein